MKYLYDVLLSGLSLICPTAALCVFRGHILLCGPARRPFPASNMYLSPLVAIPAPPSPRRAPLLSSTTPSTVICVSAPYSCLNGLLSLHQSPPKSPRQRSPTLRLDTTLLQVRWRVVVSYKAGSRARVGRTVKKYLNYSLIGYEHSNSRHCTAFIRRAS